MRELKKIYWLSLVGAWSCAPAVHTSPPQKTSAATIARFAPNAADPCASVLPFPSDLAKDRTTGLLDVPFCPTDDPNTIATKTGLRTLDGYSLNPDITVEFTGPIDLSSAPFAIIVGDAASGTQLPASETFDTTTNTLSIRVPGLVESHQYAVVITTGLLDTHQNPIVSDQVFTFVKSTEPLVDANGHSTFTPLSDADANGLEPLRAGYAPLFDNLEKAGVSRDHIAIAWTFTTQSVHAPLVSLAALATSTPPTVVHEGSLDAGAPTSPLVAAGAPVAHLCTVHSGHLVLNGFLNASGAFDIPPAASPTAVDYVLITPKETASCTDAWSGQKVAVFVHALGRCKNDAAALADAYAAAGYATLSLDGPRAGARTVGNLGDQDLDGCTDQPATPELITLGTASPNPFVIRDELREWGVELVQVLQVARAHPLSFTGASSAVSAASVGIVGHSFGGMAAVLAASVELPPDFLETNAASAELGAVFAPSLQAGLAAQLGLDPTTADGAAKLAPAVLQAVDTFRWVLEPADPLYAAPSVPATTPVIVQVVAGPTPADEAPLHASATQANLQTAFKRQDPTAVTYTLADPTSHAAICDTPQSLVGELLQPCVAATTSASYPIALGTTGAMQRQLVTFAASAGELVCAPDITVSCP